MSTRYYIPEKDLENLPDIVETDILEIISEQSKNCICKIKCNDGGKATGFFCIIPFPDKLNQIPALITNNHVISKKDILKDNKIKFTLNNDTLSFEIKIDNFRKVYTNERYDITIIEIKKSDNLDINSFLDLDYHIFKNNANEIYKRKSVYLLGYPHGGNSSFSLGIIRNINEKDDYTIEHLCKTNPGSSGCPIINLKNCKVIGIHMGASKIINQDCNIGSLLKKPLEEFIKIFKKIEDINNKNNEILLKSKISEIEKMKNNILLNLKNKEINLQNEYIKKTQEINQEKMLLINQLNNNDKIYKENENIYNRKIKELENSLCYLKNNLQKPILVGLDNIGAYCYMNATLQSLSNSSKLT